MATKPTKDEPYLILMDNHTTRFNYEVLQWMYDHHMKLYAFPPYSTPILQPLDAHGGPFHHLKVTHMCVYFFNNESCV